MSQTFILQSHQAERAGPHQDLYLEDGVNYRAWAIPKGVPTEREAKHLAIRVDDHSPEAAMFEGEIKEGYGKGTKEIIDEGTYEFITPTLIEFHGGRIVGKYYLRHWKNTHWLIWRV